jgi:hypothetical protein
MPDEKTSKYAAMLADLEAERMKIDNAIIAIKQLMGVEGSDTPPPTATGSAQSWPKTADLSSQVEFDTFFSLSIPEAIKKFLAMKKRPQTVSAITEAFKQGGLSTTATDLLSTVTATLARMRKSAPQEVVVVRRGEWGLKEWYPGRRFDQPEAKKSKKRGRKKSTKKPVQGTASDTPKPKVAATKPTAEQVEQIKKLHEEGKRPGEIAKEVGLHHFSVMGVLKKAA